MCKIIVPINIDIVFYSRSIFTPKEKHHLMEAMLTDDVVSLMLHGAVKISPLS